VRAGADVNGCGYRLVVRREKRRRSLRRKGYSTIVIGYPVRGTAMPLYVKDDATAKLVAELATSLNVTKQEAVRQAVVAALRAKASQIPLSDRLAQLRARYPLPRRSGPAADKAFFDALSGQA
jgi:antitoxin VapB